MKYLLPYHRILAVAAVGVLLLYLLLYLFFTRPLAQQVTVKRDDVQAKQNDFRKRGFPADAAYLEALLAEKAKDYDWLKNRWQELNTLSGAMFLARVNAKYGSLPQFLSQISRLDYQEEFSRIERDLRRYNIVVAEEVLGIGENTVAPDISLLMLQLWTLEKGVKAALQEHLIPVEVTYTPKKAPEKTDTAANGAPPPETAASQAKAANLILLPVRQYVLNPTDARPFLQEYPLRLRLRGKLQDLVSFLAKIAYLPPNSATPEKPFLPVSHLELRSLPPDANGDNRDLIEAELECSTFFVCPPPPKVEPPATGPTPEKPKTADDKAVTPAGSP